MTDFALRPTPPAHAGNCDDSDAHLLETAVREAREEMGCLPPAMRFAHHADAAADAAAAGGTPLHVLTRRGKALQKQFTVFPAAIEPAAKAAYVPHLNPEHVEWAWVALEALPRRLAELHPVVAILVTQHGPALQEALHALSAAQCGDCMHA